jgi:hypothetical protein
MAYPAQTTLQIALTSGATSVTPYSTAGLTAPCYLVVELEIIYCPSGPVSGAFTGVTRGAFSTTPAAHGAGVNLFGLYSDLAPYGGVDELFNAIAAELASVEVRAGAGGGGVTSVTGTLPITSSGGVTPNIAVNTATTAAQGVVQPDGTTITISGAVISVPTATTSVLGLVKPDGTTITISAGVISAAGGGVTAVTGTAPIISSGGTTPAISVSTATTGTRGVVQPDGTTITISGAVISVPTATTSTLGLVKPDGTTITISAGVISAAGGGVTAVTGTAPIVSSGGTTPAISVSTATTGARGVVQPDGTTITISGAVISVPTATTGALGLVKPDGTTITISAGVISAAGGGGLTLISQQVLAAPAATIAFNAIPGTFSGLYMTFSAGSSAAVGGQAVFMQVNGDTGAHYAYTALTSNPGGTSSSGSEATANAVIGVVDGASIVGGSVGTCEATIPGYAGTTFDKGATSSGVSNQGSGSLLISLVDIAWMWQSNAAITSILLSLNGAGNFVAGSVFTLYGLQ